MKKEESKDPEEQETKIAKTEKVLLYAQYDFLIYNNHN